MRLNKYLAECGLGSRRNVEELIEQGRIQVNGKTIMDFSTQVDVENDVVQFDGEKLKTESKVYYLLNKPKGVITTTKDDKHRKTVIELIPTNLQIFPVGRLDYNTTGALLLTNDGDFSNFLTHPRHNFERIYLVTLDRDLDAAHKAMLTKGIIMERRRSRFLSMEYPKRNLFKLVRVSTSEGRNHFVKRMFSTLGYQVVNLHREEFAGFRIDKIPLGKYQKLDKTVIEQIKRKKIVGG